MKEEMMSTAQPTGLSPIGQEADVEKIHLTAHDRTLLRRLNGEKTDDEPVWGAWVTVVVEYLHGCGLVDRVHNASGINYVISDAGRARLARDASRACAIAEKPCFEGVDTTPPTQKLGEGG